METIDDETLAATLDFIDRSHKAGKPFFAWFNTSRMHIWTHLKAEVEGKTGLGVYPDGMVEHDGHVGRLLKELDDLGIADNTIVIWTTDNGAEAMSWPDGGTTPFRGEKNTNWEGGYRVPFVIRWPGTVKPGSVYNDILSLEDALPTLMAAAGQPDVKERLVKGSKVGGVSYKVHLDGYDFGPYFRGETKAGPRREFFYWTDDGDIAGLRYDQYKLVFMEQRAHGYEVWQDPMVTLRFPKLFNLRTDPFERADHEGIDYPRWRLERAYLLVPAQAIVGGFLQTLQQFPPRQKPGSFSLGDAMEKIQAGAGGGSN
jgi:arylsulfatase A-like enzyme